MTVLAIHPLSHPSVVDRITRLEQERDLAIAQATFNKEEVEARDKMIRELAEKFARLEGLIEDTVVELPRERYVTLLMILEEPEKYGAYKKCPDGHDYECTGDHWRKGGQAS